MQGRKKTTDEFIAEAKALYGDKYDYSKVVYTGHRKKVCIIIPGVGEFWETPSNHLRKNINHGRHLSKSAVVNDTVVDCEKQLSLIEKFNKIHSNKYDYSKVCFKNWKEKICIICPIHGEFFQSVESHLYGCGCPKCKFEKQSAERRLSTEEFICRAKTVHGDRYNYEKVQYKDWWGKVCIVCSKHGEFWQNAGDHLRGEGCPMCRPDRVQSQIYNELKRTFPDEVWEWEYSPEWLGRQRFDIYNKKHNLAIEYNGIQHYMPVNYFGGITSHKNVVRLDKIKNDKCKINHCVLYIIKYDDFNMEKILKDVRNLLNGG